MEKTDKYQTGDLVYVESFIYPNGIEGKEHNFVVLDENNVIDLSYFALIISSNLKKLNPEKFPFNLELKKDNINNLRKDSIVKCDAIINIKNINIKGKFGKIEPEKMNEFILKNKEFVDSINHKSALSNEQIEYLKRRNNLTEEQNENQKENNNDKIKQP